jgi:hypothetical protein
MNFFGPDSNEPVRCESKRGQKSFLKKGLGMSYGDDPSVQLRTACLWNLLARKRRQARRQGSEKLTYLVFLKMADERIH